MYMYIYIYMYIYMDIHKITNIIKFNILKSVKSSNSIHKINKFIKFTKLPLIQPSIVAFRRTS